MIWLLLGIVTGTGAITLAVAPFLTQRGSVSKLASLSIAQQKPHDNRLYLLILGAIVLITSKSLIMACAVMTLISFTIVQIKKHVSIKDRFEVGNHLAYAVGMLSNSLRAGLPLTQALMNLSREGPKPLCKEFRMLATELSLGSSLESGLTKMASRLKLEDFDLLVTAITVQKQTGGNLPNILSKLEVTMRERQKIADKVRASTAQGRLTGLIIICLPPLMFFVLQLLQPGYFEPMTSSLLGQCIIVLLVLMDIVGGMTISKICDVKY